MSAMADANSVKIHPLPVRIVHWINVFAVVMMIFSGWKIYNAAPVFEFFKFPGDLTLGGWLGGALLWHFAAMWVLAANGVVYLAYGILSGHFRRKLLPLSPAAAARSTTSSARLSARFAAKRCYAIRVPAATPRMSRG